jgi:membrane fusion protein (multidrug efflux system)
MKRLLLYLIVIVVLAKAIWFAFLWFQERQQYESTDNAYLKANTVLIMPKVAGYITELYIDDNQIVKQGELLAKIDDRDYQAKLAMAQAKVNEEMAHIERLRASKHTQKAHIESAEAQVIAVEAKRTQINQDLQRFTALIEKGSAPRQTLDSMQAQAKEATAELQSLQASALAQQKQLPTLDSEIAQAQAQRQYAQAQAELAALDLGYTQIRAPFDGVIGHRGVQLGSYVQTGMSLAYILESGRIWIDANFKETQLEHMKIGQAVKIYVDAYPNEILAGRVDSFAPATGSEFSLLPSENATGNFTKIVRRVPVKIVFEDNADTSRLKSGLSVTVKVQIKS